MKNGEIYRRTIKFALLRLLVGLLGILAGAAVTLIGYLVTRNMSQDINIAVTSGCLVVGFIVFGLVVHYLGYMLKAGQIAMITRAVTEGDLPDDVVAEGKAQVKKRFAAANVYFALDSAIKAITNQLTRGIDGLTSLAGGGENSVLGTIGSLISMFIRIVLEYVNYCCLGWVFRNPQQSAFKSTCDGAVIYFQNWKVLLKNAGKVMAITLAFFIIIGVAFSALGVVGLDSILPKTAELEEVIGAMEDGTSVTLHDVIHIGVVFVALLITGLLFSTFVKPYLLISVMRSYMKAADGTTIGFDMYGKLCNLSKRFKKLFDKANDEEPQDFVVGA